MRSLQILLIWIIIIVLIIFALGALGYYYLFNIDGMESIYLSAVTMSSLSLEIKPKTNGQKVFVAFYSIISIGLYLILISLIVSYLVLWHNYKQLRQDIL